MELQKETSRLVRPQPICRWWISLTIALVGCATAPATRVDFRTDPLPPSPDPVAFSHYVAARGAELKGNHAGATLALTRAVEIDSTSATLHRLLARNFAALNRHYEALAPATMSAELDPSNLENRWVRYNALLMGARDTVAALSELDRIAAISPTPIRALDTSLRIHTKQQNSAGVITVLDRIVKLPNLDDRGRLIAAQNYRRNNRPARAEALLRDVLGRRPQVGDAWVQLGGIIGSRGDTLGAAQAYRMATSLVSGEQSRQVWRQLMGIYVMPNAFQALLAESPFDSSFVENLADVFRTFGGGATDARQRSGLYSRSLTLFSQLSDRFPARSELHAKTGELYLNLNQGQNARAAFDRASNLDDRPEYRLGYAHSLILNGEFHSAIDVLTSTLEKTDRTETRNRVVLTLGNAYSAIAQNAKARSVYETALESDPNHLGFGFERAQTFMRDQNWDAATETFEQLLPGAESNAPILLQTLYGLARANERGGRFETAVRLFERLIALDPTHDEALNYLGYMFAEKGVRLGEAQQFIQRALGREPENGAYLDSMGWVFYQMGGLRQAREYLLKAIGIEERALQNMGGTDPGRLDGIRENLAVIHEHAGDVAAALKQKDEARAHWSKARGYAPSNQTLVKKLGDLDAPETEHETP